MYKNSASLEPSSQLEPPGVFFEICELAHPCVAVARAVYADADVYLLDDPLSAVDNHVGAALFEEVLAGSLKNKTRVLVTNALQYLPRADDVVVLDNGEATLRKPTTRLS